MRSKALQIEMTWRTPMMAWKKSMGPPPQDHHPSSVQMVQTDHWQREDSWKIGWALWQCTQSSLHHQWWSHQPATPGSFWWDARCCTNLRDMESDSSAKQWQSTWCRLHPTEVYKEGGTALTDKLHQLFQLIWQHETVPQDFKDASIIHLYKCKGNHQACDNHCGISLLSITGKALARVLLNCLIVHLERGLLPESHCGFWKEHRTMDMVFAARQLQEKCQEQNADLYSTYVDLTKAFDTVSRDGLWRIIAKYGYPQKFITIVQQLHDGMFARVQDNGEISQPFPVSNGVKQGCVLAPTLFSIMFSAMQTDAFRDTDVGIGINYHTDGSVFNLRRLLTKTKVTSDTVNDFLFADDCSLNAASEADMQHSIDKFAEACNNFGLTISTKKTEVMHQPAPGKTYTEPNITINGQWLNVVDKYTYLGSTLSRNLVIDDEVNARCAKASAAFGRLHKNVLNRRGITLETKTKVYWAIVLTTLLCGCESWTVYQHHARKLNHFHTTCLRKLLGIEW